MQSVFIATNIQPMQMYIYVNAEDYSINLVIARIRNVLYASRNLMNKIISILNKSLN